MYLSFFFNIINHNIIYNFPIQNENNNYLTNDYSFIVYTNILIQHKMTPLKIYVLHLVDAKLK